MSIDDLDKMKEALDSYQGERVASIVTAFKGMEIVENPMMRPNELGVSCGSDLFKLLVAEREKVNT